MSQVHILESMKWSFSPVEVGDYVHYLRQRTVFCDALPTSAIEINHNKKAGKAGNCCHYLDREL